MKNLALERIQAMKPYTPPLNGRAEYGGLLLDFNERTTGPPLRLYPEYFDLTARIAQYAGVDNAQVMVTNGTDQAIDIIIRTFSDRGNKIVIPEPNFAMYAQYARINGNRISSSLEAIDGSTKLVVISNPNNPTGSLLSKAEIARIARKAKQAIIYIDEAYYEFSGVTAADLIARYPNIIVSRTFSKAFGLAGLRIGYVIAQEQYITEMLKVRGPYDVNQLACEAAVKALANITETKRYSREVMKEAKPLVEQFFNDRGIPFYPSAANFLLFKPENADAVAKLLRQNGIAVRPQDKPGVEGTIRVTIGTMQQMRAFVDTYQKVIPQKYAFIDRDGTLIDEPQDDFQIDSLAKLRLVDGAVEGLQRLKAAGYQLVMVSNQDGLGTASFPQKDFDKPQKALLQQLRKAGIGFEEIFICPHLPDAGCDCRKPKTGLVDAWLQSVAVDRDRSFVCGDRPTDQAFAANLGLKFVPAATNGNFLTAIKQEIS